MDIQAYIQSGVIESYVLGIANEQEVAELQRLRLEHPAIAAAVEQAEQWLLDSSSQLAVPVADKAKMQLLTTLENDFKEPVTASAGSVSSETPVRSISRNMTWVAAASVVLFVSSAAVNLYLYNKYTKAANDYSDLLKERTTLLATNKAYENRLTALQNNMQLMTAPGMLKVSMPGVAGKEQSLATVYWDTQTKNVYLIANNLPAAPAGKQYQLWALVDGKPVDAGMLENCEGLCQLKNIPQAQAFAITLEKAGGSPAPDLTQLYVMGKVQS